MQDYTMDSLVDLVKRRGAIPTSQQLFTPDDIIDMANDEMKIDVAPLIISVREEYFNAHTDQAIVVDQTDYPIPSDAIGMKLRAVSLYKDSVETILPRLSLEEISGDQYLSGYYISNNQVVLYPSRTDTDAYIRLHYMRRPLKLTANSNAGQITNISTNTLTLSNVPAGWGTNDLLNAVAKAQPFNTTSVEMTVVAASSPTVEVDDATGVSVGDWVCAKGDSVIPQLLEEAHIVLAQATVVKLLEALGDREGMKAAEAKLTQNRKNLLILVNPRVDSSPKKAKGRGILDV